jgi:hypothetical protein
VFVRQVKQYAKLIFDLYTTPQEYLWGYVFDSSYSGLPRIVWCSSNVIPIIGISISESVCNCRKNQGAKYFAPFLKSFEGCGGLFQKSPAFILPMP